VVENPCYQGFALACRAQGAQLRPVSVGPEGIELEQLSTEARPPLIYVTPSHQFPTGVTMPLERRRRLLDVAARFGAYVVEDDYDSEFRYDGPPVLALAGLDGAGERVLYVGTFSKSLGAALRVGFIVAPESAVGPLTKAKALASGGQPWLDQACLATFLASGEYRRHLRKLREARRQSKDALLTALARHFGAPELSGAEGGMHVLWRLPPSLPAAGFVAAARRLGVGVYTPSAAGALAFGDEPNAIVLGYSALSLEEIDKGAAALAKAARDFGAA
jgi:GntR family transcriptional regulator / MocR family aminotransferase